MKQVLDDAEWCENEIIYGVWERSHTQLDDRQNMRERLDTGKHRGEGEKKWLTEHLEKLKVENYIGEKEREKERRRNKGGKEGGVLAPAYTGPDVLRLKN